MLPDCCQPLRSSASNNAPADLYAAANSHDCLAVSQPCAQCKPEPGDCTTYYVIASVSANARSCPRTSCNVVTSFARGAAVNVLQRVTGQSVSGNSCWQAVKHNNAVVYIHAPLLSRTQPQPQQAQTCAACSSTTTATTTSSTGPGQRTGFPTRF